MVHSRPSIAVLISGSGSNLQAIINACQDGRIDADISLVLSNRADAFGLERARQAGIETAVLNHKDYDSRESFDAAMIELLDRHNPDLVVLAGFMRILSADFVQHYLGRLINIHPSLLPRYPGLHTHQRVIDAGDIEHGASVHFVTPELDAGPTIIQGRLHTHRGETADELAARVLKLEHQIYPQAIQWLLAHRVSFQNDKVYMDGHEMQASGQILRAPGV